MSVVSVSIIIVKKGQLMLVCVYCENTYENDIQVCPECNEYDGLMPVNEDNEPDESWFDADALASIGWGVDEDY